jgi:hypothetical protein
MGSYSYLRIGKLTIDSSKNFLVDHSELFVSSDYHEVEYYYADNYSEKKPGYSRKLGDLKSRLYLMGFTTKSIENMFLKYRKEYEEDLRGFNLSDLSGLVKEIDISISIYDEVSDYFQNNELSQKIVNLINSDEKYKYLVPKSIQIAYFINEFDPYFVLSLFIYNSVNLEEDVVWNYYDLVEGGWIDSDIKILDEKKIDSCILITEGSSDTKIIEAAFKWIYPDIIDFFQFIDMDKNYPFTGVGNLVNFYKGLCKIGPSKRILILFDNDTAGNVAIEKCSTCIWNIKVAKLPDSDEFTKFMTIGPSGEKEENINGKAVSIELFLDLKYKSKNAPKVRWISYDTKSAQYQGVLENKEQYSKKFFNAKNGNDENYSLIKMKYLLDYIIAIIAEKNDDESIF